MSITAKQALRINEPKVFVFLMQTSSFFDASILSVLNDTTATIEGIKDRKIVRDYFPARKATATHRVAVAFLARCVRF
jgi:hypothetical protein